MGKSKELKKLKKLVGRGSWNGVKPVTRVIPNKKKAVESRKAKHKGRRDGAGHYLVLPVFEGMTFTNPSCLGLV